MKRIGRTNLVRLGLGLLVICLIVALVVVVILLSQRKGEYQVYTGNIGTDRSCANTTLVISPNLTPGSSYQMNVGYGNDSCEKGPFDITRVISLLLS